MRREEETKKKKKKNPKKEGVRGRKRECRRGGWAQYQQYHQCQKKYLLKENNQGKAGNWKPQENW